MFTSFFFFFFWGGGVGAIFFRAFLQAFHFSTFSPYFETAKICAIFWMLNIYYEGGGTGERVARAETFYMCFKKKLGWASSMIFRSHQKYGGGSIISETPPTKKKIPGGSLISEPHQNNKEAQ